MPSERARQCIPHEGDDPYELCSPPPTNLHRWTWLIRLGILKEMSSFSTCSIASSLRLFVFAHCSTTRCLLIGQFKVIELWSRPMCTDGYLWSLERLINIGRDDTVCSQWWNRGEMFAWIVSRLVHWQWRGSRQERRRPTFAGWNTYSQQLAGLFDWKSDKYWSNCSINHCWGVENWWWTNWWACKGRRNNECSHQCMVGGRTLCSVNIGSIHWRSLMVKCRMWVESRRGGEDCRGWGTHWKEINKSMASS